MQLKNHFEDFILDLEAGSYQVVLAGLELAMETTLASNSQKHIL